jgi:hypothetical protein
LSELESVVVRSSHAASRFSSDNLDWKALASEADVDVALSGTLLRAGDQVRVTSQLVETPGGTIVWTKTAQVSLGDLFRLQDDLARQIAGSLAIPLSAERSRAPAVQRDVPASAKAYELYLRANQVNFSTANTAALFLARDLYRACVDEDPNYAPAWACLGRVYRIIGKYLHGDPAESLRLAEGCLVRALELNPNLTRALHYHSYFEVEEKGRAREVMVRLIEKGLASSPDPDLFSGLVVACRFCGLFSASIEADRMARRLDPNIRTSVQYTHLFAGNWEQAMALDADEVPTVRATAAWVLGRTDEALELMRPGLEKFQGAEWEFMAAFISLLEGKSETCLTHLRSTRFQWFRDPEGQCWLAAMYSMSGNSGEALRILDESVTRGFFGLAVMERGPWFSRLEGSVEFLRILKRADDLHRAAVESYREAGGEKLLGVAASE